MSNFQVSMLLGAAAFSLVSMVVIYLVALFALTLFLKPKPSILRLIIAFVVSWASTCFYILFRSVSYYMQHSWEMYIAELVVAVIALFAVTKLSPTKTAVPHLEVKDVLADASIIDATYEKIDQELKADNIDRATWTRAQGDAEGNAERAKALYIKYRAQRLLEASRAEPTRQSIVHAASTEKLAKNGISRFVVDNAVFLVLLVAAVIAIGFYVKQNNAPSQPDFSGQGTLVPQTGPAFPGQGDPVPQSRDEIKQEEKREKWENEEAAKFGITRQEFQRRNARSLEVCRDRNGPTPNFVSFACQDDVYAGRR